MMFLCGKEKINAFLDYNFTSLSTRQCIERIVLIWIFSTALCFVRKPTLGWMIPFGIFNILVSALFIVLIVKYKTDKISRYLCDGISCLYISVIFNMIAYRLLMKQSLILLLAFLLLLIICMTAFLFIALHNIKNDKYSGEHTANRIMTIPLVAAGACGILTAKIFLQGQSQQTVLVIGVSAFLILSFIFSLSVISFLKVILYYKQKIKK